MNISDWRQRMDEIDKKLVELLNERSQCALEIGRLKQAAGMPIYQPARENEVLSNAARNNRGPLTSTKRAPPNASPCTVTRPKKKIRSDSANL